MISDQEHSAVRQALADLDGVAQGMERKWGIGRLELAVPVDLADKFRRQAQKLDDALSGTNAQEQLTQIGGMSRAWQALDAKAAAEGVQPAPVDWWEVGLEDGSVAVLLRSEADWPRVQEMASTRKLAVFTAEEIGRLLTAYEGIVKAKLAFPGAVVERVKPYSRPIGDDLNHAIGIGA